MSMGASDISAIMQAIGKLQGELEGINTSIADIKAGKMPLCAAHAEALKTINAKLDHLDRKSGGQTMQNGGAWAFQFGKLKAAGMPAIIIAVLIGVAIINYVQTRSMKEETIQTARELAQETKAETLNILRHIRTEKTVGEVTTSPR